MEDNQDQTEDPLEAALAELQAEATRANRRMAFSFSAWVFALLLAILGVGLLTTIGSFGLVPMSMALLCVLLGALAMPRQQNRAFETLLRVADVRAVGPLLDLLPGSPIGRREAILTVLIRLLPQLADNESGRLLASQRSHLRSLLLYPDFWQEREFLIATLNAMEQIGDHEDLILVTRLAIGQSDSWQERQVRDAARVCLPRLRERVEKLKHREGLLRPACAGAPEELLHPTVGCADPDPTQLLHPDKTTTEERDPQVTKSARQD